MKLSALFLSAVAAQQCPAGMMPEGAPKQVGRTLGFNNFNREFTGDNQDEKITATWNEWEVTGSRLTCAKWNRMYGRYGYNFINYRTYSGYGTLCCTARYCYIGLNPAYENSYGNVAKSATKKTGTCKVERARNGDREWHVTNTDDNGNDYKSGIRGTGSATLFKGRWAGNKFDGSEMNSRKVTTYANTQANFCAIKTKKGVQAKKGQVCRAVVEVRENGNLENRGSGRDYVCLTVQDAKGNDVQGTAKCQNGDIRNGNGGGRRILQSGWFTVPANQKYKATIEARTTATNEHYYTDDFKMICQDCVATPAPTATPTAAPTGSCPVTCQLEELKGQKRSHTKKNFNNEAHNNFKIQVHHSVDAMNTGNAYMHHRCYRTGSQCKCECIGSAVNFQSTPNRGSTGADETNEIYNPWAGEVDHDLLDFWADVETDTGSDTAQRCVDKKIATWDRFNSGKHGRRVWGPYWGYKCGGGASKLQSNGGTCFWESNKMEMNNDVSVHGKEYTQLRAQFKLKAHQHWFGQLEWNDFAVVYMRTCDDANNCGNWYGGMHQGNTPNAPKFTTFFFDVKNNADFLRSGDSHIQTKVQLSNNFWLEEHIFDDLEVTGMCTENNAGHGHN